MSIRQSGTGGAGETSPVLRRSSYRDARRLVAEALRREAAGVTHQQGWAQVAVRVCGRFHEGLRHVVGREGLEALQRRALCLARKDHPCLADVGDGSDSGSFLVGLGGAFESETTEEAEAAVHCLLSNLVWLLTLFVGTFPLRSLLGSPSQEPPPDESTSEGEGRR